MTKKQDKNNENWISLRVSDLTMRQVNELIEIWGESRTQVIRRCIEKAFVNEGLSTTGKGSEKSKKD